jgi:hypothetical protein
MLNTKTDIRQVHRGLLVQNAAFERRGSGGDRVCFPGFRSFGSGGESSSAREEEHSGQGAQRGTDL